MRQYRVTMERSQQGNHEPRIEVHFSKGLHFRKVHAALHLLAAAVELATPPEEEWIAQTVVASADDAGWIYLELLHASDEEVQRGLEVLRRVSQSQYNGVSV